MKNRLRPRFQLLSHHCLRDPVRHRRHPEDSRPTAVWLGNLHRLHRRREVRPRRHPIPDPVQAVVPIRVEIVDRLPVHPRRTLVRLDAPVRLPHQSRRNVKRLNRRRTRLAHSSPPTRTQVPWLLEYTNLTMSRPLRSTPITGASSLLRAGPPARPHRYSTPPVSAVRRAPSRPAPRRYRRRTPGSIEPRLSQVPYSSRRPGSRRLHAGHRLASKRDTRQTHPGTVWSPRF